MPAGGASFFCHIPFVESTVLGTFTIGVFIAVATICFVIEVALSGQAVLLGRNCENAAKMTLWLCPVILYGYGNAAESEPSEIA